MAASIRQLAVTSWQVASPQMAVPRSRYHMGIHCVFSAGVYSSYFRPSWPFSAGCTFRAGQCQHEICRCDWPVLVTMASFGLDNGGLPAKCMRPCTPPHLSLSCLLPPFITHSFFLFSTITATAGGCWPTVSVDGQPLLVSSSLWQLLTQFLD